MKMNQRELKIGYVPLNNDLISAPGDYRRFVEYAKIRNLQFEVAKIYKKYDLIIVSQGADITVWKEYKYGKIVYDLVDSYLSIPKTNLKGLLRGFIKFFSGSHKKLEPSYWKTLEKMCLRSDAVICSTKDQRNFILPYCKNTTVILDYHDTIIRSVKKNYKTQGVFKIVWEGLSCNLYQLKFVSKTLQKLSEKYKIELHVITDSLIPHAFDSFFYISAEKKSKNYFHNVIFHKWNKKSVSMIICECDLAIIPVDTNYPLTSGKPENKLLLLWRMGIPVVTSSTFSYKEVMKKSGFDLTCNNEKDWFDNIESLINSESLRLKAATHGMNYINTKSNISELTHKWDKVFDSLGFDFSKKYITNNE